MSLAVLADHMAAKGRGQDSMLVHMTPQEVAGLHALALKHGGTLTINPETGLVEAGFLSSILPMVAGFALDAFVPGLGSAIGGALGTSAAVGTGIAVGGLTGLATGSLSKGLMAGLGAYGGAGLSQGLLGAGASALGTDAFNAANTLNAGMNPAAVEAAVQDKIANASFSDKLAAGFDATKANPMGFIKPNAGYLAAAAAPVIADQMVPTTVKAPPLPPAYIRPFQFDANTRKVTAQTPVLASQWGDRSFPDMIPKSYDQGGIVALADGGPTPPTTPPAPVAAPDPFARFNTLSGTSKAAYDYLMGNSPAATTGPVTPRTLTCPAGFHLENGACIPDVATTVVQPPVNKSCGPGYHEQNGVCVPDVTIDNSCPVGQTRNAAGVCVATETDKSCPVGQTRNAAGVCVAKVTDTSCPVGTHDDGAGNCIPDTKTPAACPAGQTRNAAGVCVAETKDNSCPAGQTRNAAGVCVATAVDNSCPVGQTRNAAGVCVAETKDNSCPVGQTRNAAGVCVATAVDKSCPVGQTRNAAGVCVATETDKSCPVGQTRNAAGVCVANETDKSCPVGQTRNAAGVCVATDGGDGGSCPAGQTRNAAGVCVTTVTEKSCPAGQTRVNGVCVVDQNITNLPATDTKVTDTKTTDTTATSTTATDGTAATTLTGLPSLDSSIAAYIASLNLTNTPGSGLTVTTGPATTTAGTSTAATSTDVPGGSTTAATDSTAGLAALASTLGTTGTSTSTDTTSATTGGNSIAADTNVTNAANVANTASTTGGTGNASDFTAATDLGNGLYAVDNGDGTHSIVTEDGVSLGAVGGGLESVQDWEGNKTLTGVPNVTVQGGNENIGSVNDLFYYPDTPEQQQKVNDYMKSLETSGGGINVSDFGGFGGGGGKGNIDFGYDVMEAANGGLMAPGYAMGGGLGSLGGYSDGGRLLKGPGDGVSDSIPATIGSKGQPARLADGEFVIPARIVSELGNGSTDAGARKLYAMMDRIQKSRGKTVGKGKVAANSRADKHLPA
jgi:hypothetical protein